MNIIRKHLPLLSVQMLAVLMIFAVCSPSISDTFCYEETRSCCCQADSETADLTISPGCCCEITQAPAELPEKESLSLTNNFNHDNSSALCLKWNELLSYHPAFYSSAQDISGKRTFQIPIYVLHSSFLI